MPPKALYIPRRSLECQPPGMVPGENAFAESLLSRCRTFWQSRIAAENFAEMVEIS